VDYDASGDGAEGWFWVWFVRVWLWTARGKAEAADSLAFFGRRVISTCFPSEILIA
jgi:hypothetical protein